ncbi:MAG: AarF/ABC1/UbiB kinase family protein, partial [Actinobacteria bacterium]|nr:AarF/ABC1/UbiB kinase family protein [Actinomycetota bacterium]
MTTPLTEITSSSAGRGATAARAMTTVSIAGRHAARALVGPVVHHGIRHHHEWGPSAAREVRRAFGALGPTYVKLAQLIASSPGLFPEVLSDELRSLLDCAPPVPPADIVHIVRRELGAAPDEVFARFDPAPLASASIAQVHAATLHDGTDVVVKVQRRGIRARLAADLAILSGAAQLLERTSARGRMANPVAVVEDFAATLAHELNFVLEAQAMERFSENLVAFGSNEGVRVPEVHWRYTTQRVLTMERIHGHSIDDTGTLSGSGFDLPEILKRGVRAWMEGALEHGFFHGDVHAGNLMVDTDGNLVFLDFGIVGQLDDRTKSIIRNGLPALLLDGDFAEVAKSIYDLGAVLNPIDLDQASADIAEIVGPILAQPLSQISYGQVLIDIVRVGTRYEVRLPRELVLVAKQMLYFERYAKLMAPDWNI